MVGIVAIGSRQIVFNDQTRQALFQHITPALVRILTGPKARGLQHAPELAAVAIGLGTPGKGILTGKADIVQIIKTDFLEVQRCIERLNRPFQGLSFEFGLALSLLLEMLAQTSIIIVLTFCQVSITPKASSLELLNR